MLALSTSFSFETKLFGKLNSSRLLVNYEKSPLSGDFNWWRGFLSESFNAGRSEEQHRAYIFVRRPRMRNNARSLNLSPSGTISFLTIEVALDWTLRYLSSLFFFSNTARGKLKAHSRMMENGPPSYSGA